jgi:hypothetical protein
MIRIGLSQCLGFFFKEAFSHNMSSIPMVDIDLPFNASAFSRERGQKLVKFADREW